VDDSGLGAQLKPTNPSQFVVMVLARPPLAVCPS
jgi:hypothetical protein